MTFNKKLATIGTLGVVGISSVGFVGITSAHSNTSGDALPEKIASKFNLNKDEVKKVFEEERTSHEAERQKSFSDKLQKLVDEGKLTADQKSKVEAKFKEMHEQREANKDSNLTKEQHRAEMKTHRDELKKWADENKIDLDLIQPDKPEGKMGGHGGPRKGME
ncbi:MAG: hypothetical protein AAB914_00385 [Patescibacteria group bacterium]